MPFLSLRDGELTSFRNHLAPKLECPARYLIVFFLIYLPEPCCENQDNWTCKQDTPFNQKTQFNGATQIPPLINAHTDTAYPTSKGWFLLTRKNWNLLTYQNPSKPLIQCTNVHHVRRFVTCPNLPILQLLRWFSRVFHPHRGPLKVPVEPTSIWITKPQGSGWEN